MAQTLSRLIGEYLIGVPMASRDSYKTRLDLWMQWCADNQINVLDARRFHIDAYRVWRQERLGLAPGTVAFDLTPVCCFYEYLWQERYLDRNPAMHVKRPHVKRWSDGSWLSDRQSAMFLELAQRDRRAFVAASCALMLLNGLRVREVIDLNVSDYYRQAGQPVVHVNRKADWMQEVGLSPKAASLVERARATRSSGPLLLVRGKRVTYIQVHDIIVSLGEQCGAERTITPHSLRRTFATMSRRAGVPDRAIMASGGWSTREMLDRYDMGRFAITNEAGLAVSMTIDEYAHPNSLEDPDESHTMLSVGE